MPERRSCKRSAAGAHQGTVEWRADRQQHRPLGALRLGDLHGTLHCGGRTGDHDLPGRIQIGRPRRPRPQRLRHRPRAPYPHPGPAVPPSRLRPLARPPALPVRETAPAAPHPRRREPCGHQRTVFAEAVPAITAGCGRPPRTTRDRPRRPRSASGLGVYRHRQALGRTFGRHLPEIFAQRLRASTKVSRITADSP